MGRAYPDIGAGKVQSHDKPLSSPRWGLLKSSPGAVRTTFRLFLLSQSLPNPDGRWLGWWADCLSASSRRGSPLPPTVGRFTDLGGARVFRSDRACLLGAAH